MLKNVKVLCGLEKIEVRCERRENIFTCSIVNILKMEGEICTLFYSRCKYINILKYLCVISDRYSLQTFKTLSEGVLSKR